jgi:hypothetical protein
MCVCVYIHFRIRILTTGGSRIGGPLSPRRAARLIAARPPRAAEGGSGEPHALAQVGP